jgi:hypothetical protein
MGNFRAANISCSYPHNNSSKRSACCFTALCCCCCCCCCYLSSSASSLSEVGRLETESCFHCLQWSVHVSHSRFFFVQIVSRWSFLSALIQTVAVLSAVPRTLTSLCVIVRCQRFGEIYEYCPFLRWQRERTQAVSQFERRQLSAWSHDFEYSKNRVVQLVQVVQVVPVRALKSHRRRRDAAPCTPNLSTG